MEFYFGLACAGICVAAVIYVTFFEGRFDIKANAETASSEREKILSVLKKTLPKVNSTQFELARIIGVPKTRLVSSIEIQDERHMPLGHIKTRRYGKFSIEPVDARSLTYQENEYVVHYGLGIFVENLAGQPLAQVRIWWPMNSGIIKTLQGNYVLKRNSSHRIKYIEANGQLIAFSVSDKALSSKKLILFHSSADPFLRALSIAIFAGR